MAPGVLFRAAPMSGAGAGKGLLARCICNIAFGRDPHAVTSGATAEELEKRIAAELMQGSPKKSPSQSFVQATDQGQPGGGA